MLLMDESATVLVADSEQTILKLLHTVLAAEGYEVLLAANGEEAASLIEEESVDAAIIDVELPPAGGMAVVKEIAEKKPDVVIALMSVPGTERSALSAMGFEIDRHLMKPFEDVDHIQRVVSEILEERARRLRDRLSLDGDEEPEDGEEDDGPPIKIIVADTNDEDREQMVDALKGLSAEVHEATCGQEALLLLSKDVHDVIVVGYDMDDMTADDVLLRAKRLDDAVAVVVTAPDPTLSMTTSLIKRGAAGFVEKPLKDAARTAKAILKQGRTARAARNSEEDEKEEEKKEKE